MDSFKNNAKVDLNRAGLDSSRAAEAERLVSAGRVDDDAVFELKLRPTRLAEFIGQTKAKEQLAIALEAAKSRGEALDHVLLFGPPGLGKTTLATIIANELEVGYQQTSGPALQIQGDLTAILTNLREKQVLFLDEIHRLQPVLEEKLYTALEDYKLDIIIGQGPAARRKKRPVFLPRRALRNPACQQLDLPFRQSGRARVLRRHPPAQVLGSDTPDEFASGRAPGTSISPAPR